MFMSTKKNIIIVSIVILLFLCASILLYFLIRSPKYVGKSSAGLFCAIVKEIENEEIYIGCSEEYLGEMIKKYLYKDGIWWKVENSVVFNEKILYLNSSDLKHLNMNNVVIDEHGEFARIPIKVLLKRINEPLKPSIGIGVYEVTPYKRERDNIHIKYQDGIYEYYSSYSVDGKQIKYHEATKRIIIY